jgi:hypothetical protein
MRLLRGMLTVIAARIEWFPRAALKERHVLFSTRVIDAQAPMRVVVSFNPCVIATGRHLIVK